MGVEHELERSEMKVKVKSERACTQCSGLMLTMW